MRRWTASSLAGQKQIAAKLSREGIRLVPDFVYTRTLNGFAAPIDARALALLERDDDVLGVYPVRAAYPASLSAQALPSRAFAKGGGRAPDLRTPGYRRGRNHDRPARHRRGRDALRTFAAAWPTGSTCSIRTAARSRAPHPEEPTRVERHGTQLAGLLVGSRRAGRSPRRRRRAPRSCRSASPAGSPTRRAASRSTAARDQLLAGLERAVDPNTDGSSLDAARVAVVGVTEPFAAFDDGPLARGDRGRGPAGHARRRPGGQRRARGAGVRQHRRPGRRAGRAHRRGRRPARRRLRTCASWSGRASGSCSIARSRWAGPPRRRSR